MKKIIAIIAAVGIVSLAAQAQVLLSSGLTYSQNFDSLPSTGTSGTWADNTTLTGWYASKATTTSGGSYGPTMYTVFRVDAGANNSGSLFDYGSASATDRALGSVSSGTPGTNAIGLRIKNDTATTFTGDIAIAYTGEQWRNGGNTSTQPILAFTYATSASPFTSPISALASDPAFTSFATLSFVSPTTGATAAALDGNQAANRVALSGTLAGITLNAGDEIMLRWYDIYDTGNDHGGGIDDLTVTFSVVPEPSCFALAGLGMLTLALLRRRS